MKHLKKMMNSLYTESSIKQCAIELNKNKDLLHTSMECGGLVLDNDEIVQVKVIVTRDGDEFIEPFQMLTMESYKLK